MCRCAAVVFLLAAIPAFAQEGTWLGKTILTRELGVPITHTDEKGKEVYLPLTDSIYYRVEAEDGDRVKVVTNKGIAGWLKKSDAVLPEQAVEHFTKVLEKKPNDAGAYQKRAYARQLQGDYDAALKDLNDTIRLSYFDMAGWNGRGVLYLAKRDYELALRDLSLAIRFNPNAAAGYCNRGQAWTALKEYKKALIDLDQAIFLEPTLSFAYSNRGLALFLDKEYDGALRDFETARKRDPKNSQAFLHHARMLATCADPKYRDGKKAVALAKQALTLDEHRDGEAQQVLAAAHAEAGDFAEAIRAQEKAREDPRLKDDEDARQRLDLYRKNTPYRQN
jgi:tetratricopeptide (TPR) repeat protein